MLTLLFAVGLSVHPPSLPSHASFAPASAWVQNRDDAQDDEEIRPSDEEGNDEHSDSDNDEFA